MIDPILTATGHGQDFSGTIKYPRKDRPAATGKINFFSVSGPADTS